MPKNVLIVEDDKPTLSLLDYYLREHMRYRTRVASSCEMASKWLVREHFDIILLDYWLGGHDTCDALVKECPPGAHIILLTAGRNPAELAERLKVSDWLAKPFSLEALDYKLR